MSPAHSLCRRNESRAHGDAGLGDRLQSKDDGRRYQPRPVGSQDIVRVNSPRVRENTLRTGMT